jgi:hypothetical protein
MSIFIIFALIFSIFFFTSHIKKVFEKYVLLKKKMCFLHAKGHMPLLETDCRKFLFVFRVRLALGFRRKKV